MKILCVGGGSMGRRRLRDLTHLKPGEVVLFEPAAQRCKEIAAAFEVPGFTRLEEALAQKPTAMTISTPPALHDDYVRKAMELNLDVFAEVPFVLDEKVLSDVAAKAPQYKRALGVSHTTHYYPPFRLIHDLLERGEVGKPLYVEYTLGNYLPDWHPYEDYRTFYGSDAAIGGAGLDMVLHEMNTIQWWLGKVSSVFARLSKLSSLEIKGPDNHDVLMTFASGARGFFHNDVIERGTQGRHIRVIGESGSIEWHQNLPTIRVYKESAAQQIGFEKAADWDEALEKSRQMTQILSRQRAKSGKVPIGDPGAFTYESCYLREMEHFVGAAEGKHKFTMANVTDELQTVRVFHSILRSSDGQKEVSVGAAA